jgi:hypothetical protein
MSMMTGLLTGGASKALIGGSQGVFTSLLAESLADKASQMQDNIMMDQLKHLGKLAADAGQITQ